MNRFSYLGRCIPPSGCISRIHFDASEDSVKHPVIEQKRSTALSYFKVGPAARLKTWALRSNLLDCRDLNIVVFLVLVEYVRENVG